MGHATFYCAGSTKALQIAAELLRRAGIATAREPDGSITDLLLDIPSFDSSGNLRSGEDPEALFSRLPRITRIWGGNLGELPFKKTVDLLKDAQYLAENAAITADCALKLAAPMLDTTWQLSRVLILGWGRIGKQLSKMLRSLGADVTVCARKPADRALLRAFGYSGIDIEGLTDLSCRFDLIFNTAPAPMLSCTREIIGSRCIPIDLASVAGLTRDRVIQARGLPGKMAPRASGQLIARRILELRKELN